MKAAGGEDSPDSDSLIDEAATNDEVITVAKMARQNLRKAQEAMKDPLHDIAQAPRKLSDEVEWTDEEVSDPAAKPDEGAVQNGKESAGQNGKESAVQNGKESAGQNGKESAGQNGKESVAQNGKESVAQNGKESAAQNGKEMAQDGQESATPGMEAGEDKSATQGEKAAESNKDMSHSFLSSIPNSSDTEEETFTGWAGHSA